MNAVQSWIKVAGIATALVTTLLVTTLLVTTSGMVSGLVRAQSDGFPATPPPDLPPSKVRLMEPLRRILPNGLKIVIQPNPRVPLVSVRLGVNAGSSSVSQDMLAADQIVASLLISKTRRYDEKKLIEYVRNLGGTISCTPDRDYTLLSASAMARNVNPLLELMAELVRRPVLEKEVLQAIQYSLAIQVQQGQLGGRGAGGKLIRALYGQHAYGAVPQKLEQIRNLSPEKIREFHRLRYAPDGAALVVVGDVDPNAVLQQITRIFGDWKPTRAKMPRAKELDTEPWHRVWLVDRPKSVNATILVANSAPKMNEQDAVALELANIILGGKVDSRLFNSVREKYGYAYTVQSRLRNDALTSEFLASVECRNGVAIPTIKQMIKEVETLQQTPPEAAELERAKTYALSEFAQALASQESLSRQLFEIAYFNRPDDYLKTYQERVRKVTAEDVRRVTQKYILPGRAAIIVIGDKDRLQGKLEEVGYLQKDEE